MRLEPSDISDLRPLIAEAVRATLVEVQATEAKLSDRLAFTESEAAQLLGIRPHVLGDMRRRNEISGRLAGKKIIYPRNELLRFLAGGAK